MTRKMRAVTTSIGGVKIVVTPAARHKVRQCAQYVPSDTTFLPALSEGAYLFQQCRFIHLDGLPLPVSGTTPGYMGENTLVPPHSPGTGPARCTCARSCPWPTPPR